MNVYYDLHMHSCLSPCGADDMTPNNLVNMAALAGLQVIAVADHNTTKNVPAATKVGQQVGVLVVPAMELTTKEDIHVLCLLPDLGSAEAFREYVYARLPQRKNRPKAFGNQFVMDENDEIIEEETQILKFGSSIGIYETKELLEQFGFDVEELGPSLAVRQAPFDVDMGQIEETLAEIAGKLLSGARVDPNAARDEVLHTMACKAAIKGGWHTSEKELERLVKAVMAGEVKYCPHGRPVAIELTKKELEKQFKRA